MYWSMQRERRNRYAQFCKFWPLPTVSLSHPEELWAKLRLVRSRVMWLVATLPGYQVMFIGDLMLKFCSCAMGTRRVWQYRWQIVLRKLSAWFILAPASEGSVITVATNWQPHVPLKFPQLPLLKEWPAPMEELFWWGRWGRGEEVVFWTALATIAEGKGECLRRSSCATSWSSKNETGSGLTESAAMIVWN